MNTQIFNCKFILFLLLNPNHIKPQIYSKVELYHTVSVFLSTAYLILYLMYFTIFTLCIFTNLPND